MRNSNPAYSKVYKRLCDVLTNMYATERRAMDEHPDYFVIMEAMLAGNESVAVALAQQFQDEAGDAWRERAFDCGLIDTPAFVN